MSVARMMFITRDRNSENCSVVNPDKRSMFELSISSNARNEWCFSRIDVSL